MKILLVEDNNDFLELAAEKIPLLEIERGWSFKIAANMEDASHFLHSDHFDLILLDLMLPDGSGKDFLFELRSKGLEIPSIIISVLNDPVTVLDCIKLGAVGYIDKTDIMDGTKSIEMVITSFLDEQAPITGTIAKLILESLHEKHLSQDENTSILTPREIEVLNALSKGFTMKEVANILNISKHTVPVHARNIYKKLDVSGKVEALTIARENGYIV